MMRRGPRVIVASTSSGGVLDKQEREVFWTAMYVVGGCDRRRSMG